MAQATINKTIVAVFSDYATAERVAEELFENGFVPNEVEIKSNESMSSDAAIGNTGLLGEASAAGRSAGGGIAGFFRNLFGADIDDDERTMYAEAMRRGNVVLVVRADEARIHAAQDVLVAYDPIDMEQRTARADHRDAEGERRIPVVEEELQVGKRVVERGGIRVYTRTIEQPVEEEVTLREEHVRVERRPGNREATEADFQQADEVIEVTETTEEPVVSKKARVREEVVIKKDATTRKKTIRDKVRRTDVEVEQKSGEKVSDDYTADFKRDFKSRYASEIGAAYKSYAPAYEYGYRMAGDKKYRGKSWDDIQDTLRTDYLRNNPTSKWDQVQGAVRYGWEKMTGKR
jgi:uncharacterized protein (TIGR02271 family)